MRKDLCAGGMALLLVLTPLSVTNAQASSPTRDSLVAQLDALTASLAKVGAIIMNSATLSSQARLTYLQDLLVLSSQILEMRKLPAFSNTITPTTPTLVDNKDDSRKTAAEYGLLQVRVVYNDKKSEAAVELKFKQNTVKANYELPPLDKDLEFAQKINRVRDALAELIAEDRNIKAADIKKLMLVSAYNPARDDALAAGSPEALALVDSFGAYSIVNRIEVLPDNGLGQIRIFTDQNEGLLLSLQRRSRNVLIPTYTYDLKFFFPKATNGTKLSVDSILQSSPKYTEHETNLLEKDIYTEITSGFSNVPFTSQLPGYNARLVAFLTTNPTKYTGSKNDTYEKGVCYSENDKLLVSEFVKYLVINLGAQHEDFDKIIYFLAPVTSADDNASGLCVNQESFF